MTPRKFKILICLFSYGGNGGMKSEHPDVRDWLLDAIPYLKGRPDICEVAHYDIADTPITMTRNRCVLMARKMGADFIVMLDSDMAPDLYLGRDPNARPFLQSSLDFAIGHFDRGPVVVGAPYCGPPPFENPYVFRWRNSESQTYAEQQPLDEPDARLDGFSREEAAERSGIEAVGALPTGLILYDMRAFELIEPKVKGDPAWFAYEWKDIYCSEKGSTEDVQNTRDISLAGKMKLGYNPIHVNWDSWAGHWKPKCVGKPQILTADAVGEKLARAARERLPGDEKMMVLPPPSTSQQGSVNYGPASSWLRNGCQPAAAQAACEVPAAEFTDEVQTDELVCWPQEKLMRFQELVNAGHYVFDRPCRTYRRVQPCKNQSPVDKAADAAIAAAYPKNLTALRERSRVAGSV